MRYSIALLILSFCASAHQDLVHERLGEIRLNGVSFFDRNLQKLAPAELLAKLTSQETQRLLKSIDSEKSRIERESSKAPDSLRCIAPNVAFYFALFKMIFLERTLNGMPSENRVHYYEEFRNFLNYDTVFLTTFSREHAAYGNSHSPKICERSQSALLPLKNRLVELIAKTRWEPFGGEPFWASYAPTILAFIAIGAARWYWH